MKENCLGSSFNSKKELDDEEEYPPEMTEFLDLISPFESHSHLQEVLLNYFSKEGEDAYKNTRCLTILFYLDLLLGLEFCEFEVPQSTILWKARYYMIHNQLLTSNACFLQDKSIEYYQKYLEINDIEDKVTKAYLWIEYSNCLLTFYKYSRAEEALENARELIGLRLKLTGKLGKRTKYQSFDIPQLVLNIESESVDEFIHPEERPIEDVKPLLDEGEGEFEEIKCAHRDVKMDEDSILLDKVKLKDEERTVDASLSDQIYINQFVYNELKSQANEYDLQYERINAYIEKVLERSHNWLVFSMSLFLRSKNEQEKLKTRERSMIQMQTLVDQFNDEEPGLGERARYMFTSAYPFSWNLKRQLGYSYQSIGVYMSAFELFQECEFFEEATQSLILSRRIQQAEEYIETIIEKYGETPRILCLLGDIKRKEEYYEKAWELSGRKNAKAMRALGLMKFQKGQIDESIECLKLALEINKLYPSAWYTLG